MVDVPPSDWISGCTPYSPPPPGERGTTYCSVGNVNAHTTVTIDLSIRVHPDRGDLTATVTSGDDQLRNSADDAVLIESRSEDLAIGVQGIPDPALAGDELTIRSVVTDYGPDDAFSPSNGDGVQVDVLLPPLLSILSISPGPGATAPVLHGHIRD